MHVVTNTSMILCKMPNGPNCTHRHIYTSRLRAGLCACNCKHMHVCVRAIVSTRMFVFVLLSSRGCLIVCVRANVRASGSVCEGCDSRACL